jgi:hypothetical protein
MATKTFFWAGTSGDKITIVYSGSGNNIVSISSPPNNGLRTRSKIIEFRTDDNLSNVQLNVKQAPLVTSGDFDSDFNDDFFRGNL